MLLGEEGIAYCAERDVFVKALDCHVFRSVQFWAVHT